MIQKLEFLGLCDPDLSKEKELKEICNEFNLPCERASENLLVHQCRSTKDKGSRMRRTEGQGRGSGLGRARRRRKDPRAKQEMWGTTSRSENSGWLLRLLQTGWKLKN